MRLNWQTARYAGRCATCPEPIINGDTVAFIVPGKRTVCRTCGRKIAACEAEASEQRREAIAKSRAEPPPD